LFFFTLRFEYKQRLFQFAGFGPKTYPLFDVSSKTGANTGNLGSAYAGDPVPATDTEDLGVIENKVPFIEIKTLPIPSPTTAIKDLLPAGIKVTDLPSGFTGNELYQSLVIQPSDPTKFPGLIWENQCVPPPDPGGPG
jgi:hypothetical protein